MHRVDYKLFPLSYADIDNITLPPFPFNNSCPPLYRIWKTGFHSEVFHNTHSFSFFQFLKVLAKFDFPSLAYTLPFQHFIFKIQFGLDLCPAWLSTLSKASASAVYRFRFATSATKIPFSVFAFTFISCKKD